MVGEQDLKLSRYKMPYSNLPDAANQIFEKVYNASIKGDKPKEYAAKVAWTAVKNAGYKRSDSGEWIKEESAVYVPEFSMRLTKSVYGKDNVMRVQMVASDTEADSFEERMSLELFNNFIARRNQPVPADFADVVCEESWNGGDPYLSIAHYRAGKDKKNTPGMVEESFIDGNYFKSKAMITDNDLGRAIFKAINDDLYKNSDRSDKIRVSIAFLDLKHKHGDLVFERNSKADRCPLCEMGVGDKTYLDGYLVHEAFTRVPANPRTSVEIQKMADQILTKKDDARSIVGDLADALVDKSRLSDDSVITRDDDVVEDTSTRKDVNPKEGENKYGDVKFADEKNKKYPIDTEEHIRAAWNYINKDSNASKYSSSDVSSIKSKIVAAWKAKIDKNGPPSAQTSKSEVVEMKELSSVADSVSVRDYETSPDKKVDVPELGFAASNRASTTEPTGLGVDTSSGVRSDTETDRKNDVEDVGGQDHISSIPHIGLNIAYESLKSAIEKAQTMDDSDEAMKSLVQPAFNRLGDEVRKACMKPEDVKQKSQVTTEDIRQIASEVFTQAMAEQVLPVLTELKSMIAQKPAQVQVNSPSRDVVQKRSIQLQSRTLADMAPVTSNKPQSIRDIAARSTGLKQD